MNYLITGGSGFIGGHLVDRLLKTEEDCTIKVVDNHSSGQKFYEAEDGRVQYHNVDICDYDTLLPLFENIDYVFHFAAEARIGPCIENPVMACMTNVVGTCNVLQCSRLSGVKRVVYSSTSACYGLKNPIPMHEDLPLDNLNPYSTSKLAGEDLAKMYYSLYGLETVSLRYFNVFGERMPEKGQYAPVIAIFLRQIREGGPLTIVGDGLQERDFIYVKDVVSANLLAAKSDISNCGEVFNVGSGANISVLEIAKLLKHEYVHLPPREGEAKTTLADITKIKKSLGWKPTISIQKWVTND